MEKNRRFKEPENCMAIHCGTYEQATELVYYYGLPLDFIGYWNTYKEETCYFYEQRYYTTSPWSYQDRAYALKNKDKWTIVELEDLLETDAPEKSPRQDYITCELRDGTILDFDGYCNRVSGWRFMDGYIKFVSENNKTLYEANLAIIPEREIKKIMFYNGNETLQKSIYKEEPNLTAR